MSKTIQIDEQLIADLRKFAKTCCKGNRSPIVELLKKLDSTAESCHNDVAGPNDDRLSFSV